MSKSELIDIEVVIKQRPPLAVRIDHADSNSEDVWLPLSLIEIDESGLISRARTLDPSFFNWPALSISLEDTIVPDFPLANKSFNLSYAGNDL